MHLNYNRKIAIKTSTITIAIVPQRTNFVNVFQVFLWLSLSIKLFLSSFKFWISFVNNVDPASSSNKLRIKISFFNRF